MTDNAAIVREVFDEIEAIRRSGGDVNVALDRVAEDFELIPAVEVLGVSSYRGPAGYAEFLSTWTEPFDSWSMRLERVVDLGDGRVVGSAHQSGVGKGSGVPVELEFGAVWEFRDGLLVRLRLFVDPADAWAAVGLEP